MARKSSTPSDSNGTMAPESSPLNPALQPWTGYLLRRATQRAHHTTTQHLHALGLKLPHHSVLTVLNQGSQSQIALAHLLHTDRTTMVALIDDLENLGLVQRQRNPQDRRVHDLVLTPEGENMARQTQQQVTLADQQLLAHFTPEERETFRRLLEKFVQGQEVQHP